MPIEKLTPTFSLEEERVRALEVSVPEAFADGQINLDALRELLGERLEGEGREAEHFGLFWPGKREARRLASIPSKGTLVPAPGEGIDEEATENVFIEGDNLEVLKLMQKSYASSIKMIYIDPPYNTGNDLIYKDDFSEPLSSYLKKTGQMGEEGELLTTNTKADGRFHTNWLNMMYPRLRLSRNLLREDGVIFVSIDDNEVANLRQIMTEVFGEENFVATIVWQKVFAKKNKAQISGSHDYILVYTKTSGAWNRNLLPRSDEQLEAFKNPDNDPRGEWQSVSFSVQSEDAEKRKPYRYKIKLPSGREVLPPTGRHWNGLPDRYKQLVKEKRIWFGKDGDNPPRLKVFLDEVQQGIVPDTWWTHEDSGNNQEAKKEVLELLPNMEPFGTPKPTRLIMRMLEIAVSAKEKDIVLDFFAGSGTTAHAVLKMNKQDGGNRQYICVQLPEQLKEEAKEYRAGFRSIADLTKERIRRASKKLKKELSSELNMHEKFDFGFKVFKLQSSNFKAWLDYHGGNLQELEDLFASFEAPLSDGWQENDVLTEVMLIEGFPLNSDVSTAGEFKRNNVSRVASESSAHNLYVCLDKRLAGDTIEGIASLPERDVFICFDSALTDEAKLRLVDVGNVRTI